LYFLFSSEQNVFWFKLKNDLKTVLVLLELLLLIELLLLAHLLLLLLNIFRSDQVTGLGVKRNRKLLGNLGAVVALAFLRDYGLRLLWLNKVSTRLVKLDREFLSNLGSVQILISGLTNLLLNLLWNSLSLFRLNWFLSNLLFKLLGSEVLGLLLEVLRVYLLRDYLTLFELIDLHRASVIYKLVLVRLRDSDWD